MKIIGSILIVIALVVGAVPMFTDCLAQGKTMTLANGMTMPMKCHWTARAEIAMAGPLLVVGGFMLTSQRKESLRGLAILGIVLGIFVVLLPIRQTGI